MNIPCDLNDTSWFDAIDPSRGAVFFASGVFYYFPTERVRALVQAMAGAFPGSRLVFDAANRTAVKLMLKTWIKGADIQDVNAYFSVSRAREELAPWVPGMEVSSRGFMLGYSDLRSPDISGFFRLLARVGDAAMDMQVVRLGFPSGDGGRAEP